MAETWAWRAQFGVHSMNIQWTFSKELALVKCHIRWVREHSVNIQRRARSGQVPHQVSERTFSEHSEKSSLWLSTTSGEWEKFSEHSVNIQWTFSEQSVNNQWTFSEHSVNIQWTFSEHSVNIQWTFSEHSVNVQSHRYSHTGWSALKSQLSAWNPSLVQAQFSEHSVNIQWAFSERSEPQVHPYRMSALKSQLSAWNSVNTQWTFSEHSVNIQWTFSEHSWNIQWTFSEHSVNVQWTFVQPY
jgi:hypothetical protein